MIKKNLDGIISDSILKQQLELIETEIECTNTALAAANSLKIDPRELMGFAKEYLQSPSSVWNRSSLPVRVKLQWFEFPQGLTFEDGKFRTAQIANVFKAKSAFLGADSADVDFDMGFVNRLGTELEYLVWVLKGEYEKPY